MKLSLLLISLIKAESFGTVKSKSATVETKNGEPSRKLAPESDQIKMLKARADQGCPHAKKQLEEIQAKGYQGYIF